VPSDSHSTETQDYFGSAELLPDRQSFYHKLRANKGPYYNRGQWMLVHHQDIAAVLSDSRFAYPDAGITASSGKDWMALVGGPSDGNLVPRIREKCAELGQLWIFRRNPPDHPRIRGVLRAAFTREKVQALALHAQSIADNLLEKFNGASRIEVIADLAYPLPLGVISQAIGVPVALAQMRKWSRDLGLSLSAHTDPTHTEKGFFAIAGLAEFVRKAIPTRGDESKGLLGLLLEAVAKGDLSRDELLANCAAMLVAGHVTTQHLIGNAMLLLLTHPDQLQQLRENPALLTRAVEEVLRYEPPVQSVRRVATGDVVLNEATIRTGDRVISLIAAANRDPELVPDPERFDITRPPIQHFSFGGGSHLCLGANLARLEAAIAIGSMLRHFPRMRLESEHPDWEKQSLFRGLETLPILLE
jgi:pimeloyl-[acyl-carrier protein] synthase